MIIHVTQDHIERGTKCNCYACPVALALNEQTDEAWQVTFVGLFSDITRKRLSVPKAVKEFIRAFDAELQVAPFEFELDI